MDTPLTKNRDLSVRSVGTGSMTTDRVTIWSVIGIIGLIAVGALVGMLITAKASPDHADFRGIVEMCVTALAALLAHVRTVPLVPAESVTTTDVRHSHPAAAPAPAGPAGPAAAGPAPEPVNVHVVNKEDDPVPTHPGGAGGLAAASPAPATTSTASMSAGR